MKTKLITLFTLALSLLANKNNAQVSNYSFTQTLGSYGPINTGTLIGSNIQDDDINQVAIPFMFTFNGSSYNTVNVSSNGFISFGSQQVNSYNPISTLPQDIIAPFAQDLWTGKVITGNISTGSNTITNVSSTSNIQIGDSIFDFMNDFGGQNPVIQSINGNDLVVSINAINTNTGSDIFITNGSIKQNIFGLSPNRVCEFEYRNISRFTIYDESINFKIRLYESSNNIEFVYGSMLPGLATTTSEVGLKGSNASDFNSRFVDSNLSWATSISSTLITDNCEFSPSIIPVLGLTYQWSPSVCAQPTLSTTQTNSLICAGQNVTLTVSGATSYTWSNGANSNSIVVAPSTSTVYSVIGANANCVNTSSVNIQQGVSICTDIKQKALEQISVNAYPNPFNTELILDNNYGETCEYYILTSIGSIIANGEVSGIRSVRIDASNLKPGIYLIKIVNGENSVTKKVIKN
ncbi:MAG: T9SS type A sorting domain-containing protein [Bacteroidota bacterium]|nr:T9SS type A sorting domain-containing protein [Bacteroidota bacterium]